jgi:UDP-glucose 4-epimerase
MAGQVVSTVLVTGASGFLGSRLVSRLQGPHAVVALSRSAVTGAEVVVNGSFASIDDLRLLDAHPIDVVVHLAAATGGSSEDDGIDVNVVGTRRLLRYGLDRGIRRFVLASSIAVVGCLSPDFVPRALPIPDDHPCDAVDAYGLSKHLMEELAAYLVRRHPDTEIDLARIGSVQPVDAEPVTGAWLDSVTSPFVSFGSIVVDDVIEVLTRAVELPLGPGLHRYNVVAPLARTPGPTTAGLRQVLGRRAGDLDLSFYERAGRERAGIYSTDRVQKAYGWRAWVDPAAMVRTGVSAADRS